VGSPVTIGSAWGAGYVTDVAYVPGYYRFQSPLHLNLACLMGGVAGVEITPTTQLSYLELGCGQGFGALILAACNPDWQVTGVDFNPAHIAAARELAAAAGIANTRFIEADLATLAEEPAGAEIPQADVVTMHGLWSWVSDKVRAGIVRLFAVKIRPGGLAYVSYNALPAWQGALGMQRLLREAGERVAAASDRQALHGLGLVQDLVEAKARHLDGNPFVGGLLEHARQAQPAYLAHEYMNAEWRPCFHADVVAALAAAKLDWVASAQLLENFSALMLPDPVRAIANRHDDPLLRELIKDMCLTRGLRQDVFVRGARRLSPAERDAALLEVMLTPLCRAQDFAFEIDVPTGKAAFGQEFYGPILAALDAGPQRIGELLALPGLPRRDNPAELAGMLVGSEQALPVLGLPAPPDRRAAALNRAAAQYFVRPDNLNTSMALAVGGTGNPLPCPMLDLFVADRLRAGEAADPAQWAAFLGAGRPESEQHRLREFCERLLAQRAPIWRAFGLVPQLA
jgi:SAM-dependent methyltransferase